MKWFPERSFAHNLVIYARWQKWGRICTVTLGGSLRLWCASVAASTCCNETMSQLWVYRPICALQKKKSLILFYGQVAMFVYYYVGTGDVKVWILCECRESAELFSLNGCKGPTCAHCIASLYCTLMSRSGKTIFTFLLDSWFWRLLQCISNRTVVLFQPVLFSYLHTDQMEVAENRRCEDELVCGGSSSGRRLAPGCFSFW